MITLVPPGSYVWVPELGPTKPWPRSVLLLWFLVSPIWLPVEFTLRLAWDIVTILGEGDVGAAVLPPLGRWMTPSRLVREWSRNPARWGRHLDRVMADLSEYYKHGSPPFRLSSLRVMIRHHPKVSHLHARDYHGAGIAAVVEAAHRHGLVVALVRQTEADKQPVGVSAEVQEGPLLDWLTTWRKQKVLTRRSNVRGIKAAGGRLGSMEVGSKRQMR